MKLEEMILVIESRNGMEVSYLSSFENYIEVIAELYSDSAYDVAFAVEALYETKQKKEKWGEIYITSNHTYQARFCGGESELRGFLRADSRREKQFCFDDKCCSKECLEVLAAYGLRSDGHNMFNSLHYEVQDHTFQRGETLRNMNGSYYLVLSVLDRKNLLLYEQNDGQLLVGVDTAYFKRTPKERYDSQDSEIFGVEWSYGIYLGFDIVKVDLEKLKRDYGRTEEIECKTSNCS